MNDDSNLAADALASQGHRLALSRQLDLADALAKRFGIDRATVSHMANGKHTYSVNPR